MSCRHFGATTIQSKVIINCFINFAVYYSSLQVCLPNPTFLSTCGLCPPVYALISDVQDQILARFFLKKKKKHDASLAEIQRCKDNPSTNIPFRGVPPIVHYVLPFGIRLCSIIEFAPAQAAYITSCKQNTGY
jgi:hypothetical protein